jgi:hypothetical protein
MNPNPFSDVVAFVTNPVWTTAVFWLLVLASVVIAVYVWNRLPEQRSFSNTVQWAIRLVMGAFWWQQSLWKLPPCRARRWTTSSSSTAAVPIVRSSAQKRPERAS